MAAHLDRVLQGLLRADVSSSRAEASKEPKGGDRDWCQKRRHLAVHASTRPLPPHKVRLFFRHDPLKRQAQAVGSKPRQWGH
jgi:hypothetical protein